MQRTTATDAVAVLPAYGAGPESPGYYEDTPAGTVVRADDLNLMQEEICNAITDNGLALSGSNDDQLATVISPVKALKTDASDTTSTTTTHTRALLASTGSRARGEESVAIACESTSVHDTNNAAIACLDSVVGVSPGGGDPRSFAAACDTQVVKGVSAAALASDNGTVEGTRAAATATDDVSTAATTTNCQVIASEKVDIDGTAAESSIIACSGDVTDRPEIDGASVACALVACRGPVKISGGESSAAIACGLPGAGATLELTGDNVAAIGCKGDVTVSGNRTVVLASDFAGGAVTISDDDVICGGDSGGVKWKISSATGDAEFNDVDCETLDLNTHVADGTGSNVQLPSVGGTGRPATDTAAGWLKIQAGGTDYFFPVWS